MSDSIPARTERVAKDLRGLFFLLMSCSATACLMIGVSAAASFKNASWPKMELISMSWRGPFRRAASACMSMKGTSWSSRTAMSVAGVRTWVASI